MLNSKNEISTDVYYKDKNTHDYSHMTVPIQNLARIWLKNNKYPDHIISNAFHNAKLQGPAPKPKNNFSNIPFVTSFHENTDNKIIMKSIKRKIENTPSDCIKWIFQESNIFLPQRQPKNLLRLLRTLLSPEIQV